jgi:hypothetical protein
MPGTIILVPEPHQAPLSPESLPVFVGLLTVVSNRGSPAEKSEIPHLVNLQPCRTAASPGATFHLPCPYAVVRFRASMEREWNAVSYPPFRSLPTIRRECQSRQATLLSCRLCECAHKVRRPCMGVRLAGSTLCKRTRGLKGYATTSTLPWLPTQRGAGATQRLSRDYDPLYLTTGSTLKRFRASISALESGFDHSMPSNRAGLPFTQSCTAFTLGMAVSE